MRTYLLIPAFALLAACSQAANDSAPPPPPEPVAISAPSGEYALDKSHSSLSVRVMHFGLSHYTLRFTDFDAQLRFNAENPTDSSIAATVNIPSIKTDYVGDRDFDAELQNSEWLSAAEHPVAEFRSNSVALLSENTGHVSGELTINGVTRPMTFEVTFNNGYPRHPAGAPVSLLGFSAKGSLRRSEYGLNVLLPQPGSNAGVANDVELIIEAEFRRPIAEPDDSAATE